jgi:hypothetical protein
VRACRNLDFQQLSAHFESPRQHPVELAVGHRADRIHRRGAELLQRSHRRFAGGDQTAMARHHRSDFVRTGQLAGRD